MMAAIRDPVERLPRRRTIEPELESELPKPPADPVAAEPGMLLVDAGST